jgi:3-methyl-2-oxobutanoate hydroxymethyltransferase
VPNEVGAAVTAALEVPVIGIGAGPDVDGQILVLYDVLGITQGRMPRFVKNFMTDNNSIPEALQAYVAAVKQRNYPAAEHCFS